MFSAVLETVSPAHFENRSGTDGLVEALCRLGGFEPMFTDVTFNPAASPVATSIWNDVVGPKYARYERIMVDSATLHSDRIWDRFPIGPRDHVVDVGCGFGDTSQRLAERARHVTAVDCAAPLLSQALAYYPRSDNLEFVLADVGQYRPIAPVDACFSRFGLMFFERPV